MVKQLKWLNCIKFFAIITVLLDHTYGVLYGNNKLLYASLVGVPLFILISGITSYISNERHNANWLNTFTRSTRKLAGGYCIAVLIHELLLLGTLDLEVYWDLFIHFYANGSHYFVLLYFQLMVANHFFYKLLKKNGMHKYGWFFDLIALIIVGVFAEWSTNHTNIGNVYGGGGKLLGGTYLLVYFIGMLLAKYSFTGMPFFRKSSICLIGGGAVWAVAWSCICKEGYNLKAFSPAKLGLNPPNLLLIVESVGAFLFLFGLITLLYRVPLITAIMDFLNKLGRHTMYIFLYHDILFSNYLIPYFHTGNVWFNRILFLTAMIGIPILLERIIYQLGKAVKNILSTPQQ